MVDTWKAKDARLAALELRVEEVSNGQRRSLEQRFDLALEQQRQSTEMNKRVGDVLHEQAEALRGFIRKCPLATDSDVDQIVGQGAPEIDEKTAERIARHNERKERREEP